MLDPCKPEPTVVIIGAGMAGLSAAHRLAQCGLQNFTILEATDRYIHITRRKDTRERNNIKITNWTNVRSQTRRSDPFVLVGRRGGRDGCHLDRGRMRGESCIHFGCPRGSSETAPVQAWSESRTLLHERRPCYRSPRQHYGLSYISTDRAAGGNSFLPRLWPDPRYVAEFHGRPNSAGAPQFPGGATVQLPRSTANCITSDVKVVVNNILVLTS